MSYEHRVIGCCLTAILWCHYASAGIHDTDADGVPNAEDNCVLLSNPSQNDTDADGWGNVCDADFNNDGIVNFLDASELAANFLGTDSNFDLTDDGLVNFLDLSRLSQMYLQTPGPAGYAQWVNSGDGIWESAANWFPAAIPPAEATVTLDHAADLAVTFTGINQDYAVDAVINSETLIFDGGAAVFRVNGNLASTGEVMLASGVLSVGGTFAADGGLLFEGGTFADGVLSSVVEPLLVEPPIKIFPDTNAVSRLSNVTLAADLVITPGNTLEISDGLTFEQANIALDGRPASGIFFGPARLSLVGVDQTLDGQGEIHFQRTGISAYNFIELPTESGSAEIGSDITIRAVSGGGTVGELDRKLTLNGDVISDDIGVVIELIGSPLDINGNVDMPLSRLDIDGEWSTSPDTQIDVVTTTELQFGGSWVNRGTINVTGGRLKLGTDDGDEWSNLGTINLSGVTLSLDGTFLMTDLGDFTHDGPMLVTGTLLNEGLTLDLDTVEASSFTIGSGGILVGGTVQGSQPLFQDFGNVNFVNVSMGTDLVLDSGGDMFSSNLNITGSLTLLNTNIELNAPGGSANIFTDEIATIEGVGEIVFNPDPQQSGSGVTIRPGLPGSSLTIGSQITARTGTGGARLSSFGGDFIFNGTLISNVVDERVSFIGATDHVINGSISIGQQSTVRVTSAPTFGSAAALDIDIGPDSNGVIEFTGVPSLNGSVNLALVGGVEPMECERYTFATFPSASGAFTDVFGPDFGDGETFQLVQNPGSIQAEVPGEACSSNSTKSRFFRPFD